MRSWIQFSSLGGGTGGPQPVPIGDDAPNVIQTQKSPNPTPVVGSNKIRAFGQSLAGDSRHEDNWKRSPNVTGAGAIHVKSFHCKLTGESLDFLDRQINEWLDAHPQYEVKFVTSTVGEWMGKIKEPNLILQVWV